MRGEAYEYIRYIRVSRQGNRLKPDTGRTACTVIEYPLIAG